MINKQYTQYAEDVLNDKITACKYVKLACKRFMDWFERPDLEFREDAVDKVVRFVSKLTHSTGQFNNLPFTLLPWQLFLVSNMYGWYYKDTNKRVTRNVFVEVGRKAGKSSTLAALALYNLIIDEAGAEVDCIANTRQQAHILFDAAHDYISKVDPNKKLFKQLRETIKFPARKGFMQVLASDSSKLDGFNSSCGIMDEVHEYQNSKIRDVLASSQGSRQNPFLIMITSAGFNIYGFCYEYRNVCIEILNGTKQDDSQFSLIYEIDDGDDWLNDESCWVKANPSLDVTVSREYLRNQIQQVKNNPSLEVGVATKNFGKWQRTSEIWIQNQNILECTENVDINKYSGMSCYLAFDLASISDLSALNVCIPYEGKYIFKTWYFLPHDTIENSPNREDYKKWVKSGELICTDGNVTDYDYIFNKIMEINKVLNIDKISYDSWNATQFVIKCVEEGLPMQPYSQTLGSFNKPTKELERLILQKNVIIDNNRITRWCFSNCVIKSDHNDNIKPVKGENYNQKIDGVIAMIMSLGGILDNDVYNTSITVL